MLGAHFLDNPIVYRNGLLCSVKNVTPNEYAVLSMIFCLTA